MRYPSYDKYKDSGVQWLGEVPEHWEVKRLKTSATYRVSNVDKLTKEDELPVRLCNYTDVYYNDSIHPNMDLMRATASAEEIQRFRLRVNDILITKDSEDWRDIAIPARVEATAPNLLCGYHLAMITPDPKSLDGGFLLRSLQSCAINQQFQIASSGVTRYGLPKSSIGEALIFVPPISEQTAIADFLDQATGKIDTLVAKKRTLIERLKEKRTALISRTVTRGLPADVALEFGIEPHTRFKDSGIEWLGQVPVGWETKQLKWAIMFQRGHDLPSDQREDGPIPVVSSAGISAKHNVAIAKGPGIVTGRYGTIGKFHLIEEDYWPLNTTLYSIELRENDPFYLCYMLEHLSPLVILHSVKSAVPGVDRNDLHPTVVSMPQLSEQVAISTYLDRETTKIDKLIDTVETAIDRLLEYRTSLITAAVTGKIDVREAAA